MSVPVGRRKQSRFEAQHQFYRLRDEVTKLTKPVRFLIREVHE